MSAAPRGAASLLLALTLTGVPMSQAANVPDPLYDYRWRHRVVLVLSPAADDPRALATQASLAARACEAADRDLLLVHAPARGAATAGGTPMAPAAVQRLRTRHGAADDDFLVLLVGKDGGVKLRAEGVPDLDAWFGRIDAMPMRAAEMDARVLRCGQEEAT